MGATLTYLPRFNRERVSALTYRQLEHALCYAWITQRDLLNCCATKKAKDEAEISVKPPAHRQPSPEQVELARLTRADIDFVFSNLNLLLAHQQAILSNDSYFFCRPKFASYGVYFSRPITLGCLLIGWRLGVLRDYCCTKLGPRADKYSEGGTSHVHHFGGMGSGTRSVGFCTKCAGYKRSYNNLTFERMAFVESIHEQCRDWVDGLELEHFPASKFSFGEPAIVATTAGRMKRAKLWLIEAATVSEVIEELTTGKIRVPTPNDRTLLPKNLILKGYGTNETKTFRLVE